MISAVKRLAGNTLEIQVNMSWSDVKTSYDEIFNHLLSHVEASGFRKGKVPKDIAEKQINKSHIYEEVLKKLIPDIYTQVVKENQIKPVISPKVEVLEAQENKDWKIRITTAEKPAIKLGNYRSGIDKLIDSKRKQIWTPKDSQDKAKSQEPTITEILETLEKEISVEISPLIIEHEVNRLLSDLVDQTQKLGMTIEQYLQAKGLTSDLIRENYKSQAQKTLSLEFALEEIADLEKVTVENQEIDQVINQAKTQAEKETLEKQRYYLGSLLRRQKTLQKLLKPTIIKP